MPIPDYQQLMLPVLLEAEKGLTTTPVAAESIADKLGLSESERTELLPSGKQRLLHNRIHWAKFYLSKAELLEIPSRGKFKLSPSGMELLSKNPKSINLSTLKAYPSFMAFYMPDGATEEEAAPNENFQTESASSSATPEEQIDAAHNVLQAALKADLLQRILANSPTFFEQLVVDLLVAMGYGGSHENATMRLGKSGDGGVDGVIDEDRLGLDRIYVQAKRYAPHISVGSGEIRNFVGSLVGVNAAKGVFLTTSSYARGAIDFTRHLPQRVILIDGDRLTNLMVEYGVGVRINRTIDLKRLDEDFFSED